MIFRFIIEPKKKEETGEKRNRDRQLHFNLKSVPSNGRKKKRPKTIPSFYTQASLSVSIMTDGERMTLSVS